MYWQFFRASLLFIDPIDSNRKKNAQQLTNWLQHGSISRSEEKKNVIKRKEQRWFLYYQRRQIWLQFQNYYFDWPAFFWTFKRINWLSCQSPTAKRLPIIDNFARWRPLLPIILKSFKCDWSAWCNRFGVRFAKRDMRRTTQRSVCGWNSRWPKIIFVSN